MDTHGQRGLCLYSLLYSIPLLFTGLTAPAAFADLRCTINAERSECSALPIIRHATIDLTALQFDLHAQYEACFSIRNVHIQGRVLQSVQTDKIRKYELLGETYEPVTDFIPFPRTIAYIVLETLSGIGSFTDVWSAQQLPRHPLPSLLTVPVSCREYKKEL